MKNYDALGINIEKKYARRDRKKRPRMTVHGKQIFDLQKMMEKSAGQRIQKLKKDYNWKNIV